MRKILSLLLTIALLASMVILPVNAAGSVTPIEGVMWEFDAITGTITFTGFGPIPDFVVTEDEDNRPWAKFADTAVEIVIGEGITAVGDNIFHGFKAVLSVTLPEGITDIGEGAFAHCSFTEIEFPSTLKTIGDSAFESTDLTALQLPVGVTTIGKGAFSNSPIATVSIPETVTDIGESAFFATFIRSVMIPSGITVINDSVFASCEALEFITLPGGLISIGEDAFYGCKSLAAISIPDGVISIGAGAFMSSGLTEVRLPAALTELGGRAFAMSEVKRLVLPDSATGITGYSIAEMDKLEEFYISETNTNYVLEDDILFSYDKSVLVAHMDKDGAKSCTVPEGVTEISDGAFYGAGLTTIVLPESLKVIGDYAFAYSAVTSLRVPAGVESVGKEPAVGCTALSVMLFAGKDTVVDEDAFPEYVLINTTTIYGWEDSSVHAATKKGGAKFAAIDNELGYMDVNTTMWSYEGIEYAVNNGLFRGMSTMYFMPEVKMNRAMLVTVLHRLEGEPEASEDYELPFTDADEKGYYYEALLWAAEGGVINGVSPTTFAPNEFITREQLVTVLYRYAVGKGEVAEGAELDGFVDADTVSDWALEAMKWSVAEGIIAGMGTAEAPAINPKGEATRAQVATIFQRFCTEEEPPAEDENPEDVTPPAEDDDPEDVE